MQRRHWLIASLATAALASGCASPYGRNVLAGGYNEKQIDESHYTVSFDGNGYTSPDRVWYFWIYRCAELTKEKGYTHFDLARPPAKTSQWTPGGEEEGVARRRNAAFIYIPGGTIRTWHSSAVVAMYKEPFPDSLRAALLAQSILDDLDPYVKSDGKQTPPSREDLFKKAATRINLPAAPAEEAVGAPI